MAVQKKTNSTVIKQLIVISLSSGQTPYSTQRRWNKETYVWLIPRLRGQLGWVRTGGLHTDAATQEESSSATSPAGLREAVPVGQDLINYPLRSSHSTEEGTEASQGYGAKSQ